MADYATLLRDHITLTCGSIDRIFLQAYVPKLQSVGQVCLFLNRQRGFRIPSSAAFGQIGEAYVAAIHRWARAKACPFATLPKATTRRRSLSRCCAPRLKRAARARWSSSASLRRKPRPGARGRRRARSNASHPHMEWGRQMVVRQPFLLLSVGSGVGPGVLEDQRLRSVPDLAMAEWPQLGASASWTRLASRSKRSTTASAGAPIPAALQRICNRLGASAVHTFFWRWFHRLPSPFTADDLQAGYAYELAFRQFEVSDTRVFDRPQAGRAFFEGVIRDHLDVGRPDQVVLIFDRKLHATHTRSISRPGSSPAASTHSCPARTSPAASSNTSSSARRSAPSRHQRYPRLWDRSPRLRHELDSPTGRWRLSQPASV